MEITIKVPSSVYLIPLARALSDYVKARQKSHDNELRGWAYVMQNVLTQVEQVQVKARDEIKS